MKSLIPWKRKSEELAPVTGHEDHPFDLLRRQMNELFDDFFGGTPGLERFPFPWRTELSGQHTTSPGFEVSETDEEVRVRAELPGLDEKDISVELDDNVLTIRGEKKAEREEKKRNYYVSELSYGQFMRSVPLPGGIDRENVKGRFKKGVLTLTLPKTEQGKSRRKQIQVSAE